MALISVTYKFPPSALNATRKETGKAKKKKKWTKIKEKKERGHSAEGNNTEMQETSLYSNVELCSPDRHWQQSFQDSFHREG